MTKEQISTFNVIGISVRTTNENGQAAIDIPVLWNKFINDGIADKIPFKKSATIYCIYTDYEKDHTLPYTTILGCEVKNLESIPAGMTGKTIEAGMYQKFVAKGSISEGMVFNEWTKIWNTAMDRSFTADFEMYGEKARNPADAEVAIFVGVN